jgi:hypothetical protein
LAIDFGGDRVLVLEKGFEDISEGSLADAAFAEDDGVLSTRMDGCLTMSSAGRPLQSSRLNSDRVANNSDTV